MSSSVPLAVPQFMAIAEAALPAGFQVRFGTTFGVNVQPQALLVTGIFFNQDEYSELGQRYQHEEHYNINCSLTSVAGNDDQPTRLQEVYVLYKDIMVAVAAAPTLNGTVRLAWFRQLDYQPTYDPKGFSVGQLDFEVRCQARVDALA